MDDETLPQLAGQPRSGALDDEESHGAKELRRPRKVESPDAALFGPYRLEELIGRGGMGEVHRAFDTKRGRSVALKRLPPGLADDPTFRARFRSEAALAAKLNEPHVVPIHDFGEIDGRLYIDMRLVEGLDLARLLAAAGGGLAADRVVTIVAQIAAALDAAHAAGLVHRDIKPGNILVTEPDDFVYVADFGIARFTDGAGSGSLTSTGTTIGSLDYVAPERFGTGYGDRRADGIRLSAGTPGPAVGRILARTRRRPRADQRSPCR